VSRPVEVDDKAESVEFPARVLADLCRHAWDTSPEECCGLIIGDENERYQRVVRCHNDMNQRHKKDPEKFPRDAKTAFWMRETDQNDAEEAAKEGRKVTAVYHSHVGVNAYLSEEDLSYLEHERFRGADQIVIAVPKFEESQDGRPALVEKDVKPRVAVFRRDALKVPFVGHLAKESGA
jgi:proteasome lid subunit RPN8/RPN11